MSQHDPQAPQGSNPWAQLPSQPPAGPGQPGQTGQTGQPGQPGHAPSGTAPAAPVAQLPAWIRLIPGAAWARAGLLAAIALGGSFVAALLTSILLVLSGSSAEDLLGDEVPLASQWFPLTLQLLGLGYLSPLTGRPGAESWLISADTSFSVGFIPVIVPIAGYLAVRFLGAKVGGNLRAPQLAPRVLLAVLAGLAAATVLTILAATIPVGFSVSGFSMNFRAASFLGFLGAFLLVGAIVYLALRPHAQPQSAVAEQFRSAFRLGLSHLGALALVFGVAGVIVVAIKTGEASSLLWFPLTLPWIGMALVGLGHLIPVQLGGKIMDEVSSGTGGTAGLFSPTLPGWVWPVVLVLVLAFMLLAALRWRVSRGLPTANPLDWVVLPSVYAVLGLVLQILTHVTFGVSEGSKHVSGGLGLAAWGFLIFAVLGALVELLSRYAAIPLLGKLSPAALSTLSLGLTPAALNAAPAQPGGQSPPQQGFGGPTPGGQFDPTVTGQLPQAPQGWGPGSAQGFAGTPLGYDTPLGDSPASPSAPASGQGHGQDDQSDDDRSGPSGPSASSGPSSPTAPGGWVSGYGSTPRAPGTGQAPDTDAWTGQTPDAGAAPDAAPGYGSGEGNPGPSNPWLAPSTSEQPAARQPLSRKAKRAWIGGAVAVGVLGVLAIGGTVARGVIADNNYSPKAEVEAYLQALVDGRASDAVKVVDPNVVNDRRVLLGNEVYAAASNRPAGFTIDKPQIEGNGAVVTAVLKQNGKDYPLTFVLEKNGSKDVFFDAWKLSSGPSAGYIVYYQGDQGLEVNGVKVDAKPSYAASDEAPMEIMPDEEAATGFPVLPGTYTFKAPAGTKYVSAGEDRSYTVTPEGVTTDGASLLTFPRSYNAEALQAEVQKQIDARIASCITDKVIVIPTCKAASWEDTYYGAMQKLDRSWDKQPVAEVMRESDYGQTTDLAGYTGPLSARVTDGDIDASYEVRDEDGEPWSPRTDSYNPFNPGYSGYLNFPISIDGDTLTVDMSALDTSYNDWLKPERR